VRNIETVRTISVGNTKTAGQSSVRNIIRVPFSAARRPCATRRALKPRNDAWTCVAMSCSYMKSDSHLSRAYLTFSQEGTFHYKIIS
jgi:hypothetical protein